MTKKYSCPNCAQPSSLDSANSWRPFCSERCRLIDLGEWMNESNKIASTESAEFLEHIPDDEEFRH
ncbi:MAG: DNA gyrase inhibitor YacG [Gammaproteobacteria bacterium]|nr:DNA gyrase inhibitor YacG [Gammaproteobacteria bacterium]